MSNRVWLEALQASTRAGTPVQQGAAGMEGCSEGGPGAGEGWRWSDGCSSAGDLTPGRINPYKGRQSAPHPRAHRNLSPTRLCQGSPAPGRLWSMVRMAVCSIHKSPEGLGRDCCPWLGGEVPALEVGTVEEGGQAAGLLW